MVAGCLRKRQTLIVQPASLSVIVQQRNSARQLKGQPRAPRTILRCQRKRALKAGNSLAKGAEVEGLLTQQSHILALTLSILGLAIMIRQLGDLASQHLTIDLLDRCTSPRM